MTSWASSRPRRCKRSTRSPRATAPGSTAASSSWSLRCIDRIPGDDTLFENGPLESLAADGELRAYRHHGFWQPMDTLRDLRIARGAVGGRRGAVGGVEHGTTAR